MMRCVQGFSTLPGFFAMLIFFFSIAAVSGDSTDKMACFRDVDNDVRFEGYCTSKSEATFEVATNSFTVLLEYKAPELIGKTIPLDLEIAGCKLTGVGIGEKPRPDNKMILFANNEVFDFPVTIEVRGNDVKMRSSNKKNIPVCSSARSEQVESGGFKSTVSVDLKGAKVSSFSVTVKHAKIYGSSSMSSVQVAVIIVSVIAFIVLLSVVALLGVYYVIYSREQKKTKKKEEMTGSAERGEGKSKEVTKGKSADVPVNADKEENEVEPKDEDKEKKSVASKEPISKDKDEKKPSASKESKKGQDKKRRKGLFL